MVMHYNVSLGTKRVISSRRITLLKVVHVNVLTSEFENPALQIMLFKYIIILKSRYYKK